MPKRTKINATVEVILLESDKHLGEKFEVVRVKPIFAKNVLLPKSIAVLATPGNLNNYKQKMEAAEAARAKRATGFNDMVDKVVADGGIVFEKKANEKGVLYSKLDAKEIADKLTEEYGVKVEDYYLKMKKKISTGGEFKVPFVYKDVERDIQVVVKMQIEKEKKNQESMTGRPIPPTPEEKRAAEKAAKESEANAETNTDEKTEE